MSSADAIPLPAVLWRRLSSLGIDPAEMLRQAGLSDHLCFAARPKVATRDFFAIWRALERMTEDPAVSIRVAKDASSDQLDVTSIAAIHAATFAGALDKFGRYKRLVCPEDVQVHRDATHAGVSFHWLLSDEAPPPALIDACMATVLVIGRYGLGAEIRPIRVELSRPESHRDTLESYYQCPVTFGSPADRLFISSSVLDLPFKTANRDLLDMLMPGLEAELPMRTSNDAKDDLPSRVRRALRLQMQGQRPSLEAVARTLAMSSRSLQRRLADHGTSYQSLLDEVRRSAAIELLEITDLESGEIAFLLGFEEVNSFHRAFSSWTSSSPYRWRQERRSTARKLRAPRRAEANHVALRR